MSRKKKSIAEIMAEIQAETPDGAYTLGGFVCAHFDDICKQYYWRAPITTKRAHLLELANIIIPAIEDHDNEPISAYDEAMISRIMESIAKTGRNSGDGKRVSYEKTRLEEFERLLRQFIGYAEKLNICAPISNNKGKQRRKPRNNKTRKIVRRDMSPIEEAKFLTEVLPLLNKSGPARIAILIYGAGLRPSEACGCNWDALMFVPETEIYKLSLPQSVEPGYNRPKPTMKTPNGHRVMVTNKLVYDLLMLAKKDLLVQWIEGGNDASDFGVSPLGTKGESLIKRCANYDVAHFVNEIFEKIGIRESDLEGIKNEMRVEYEELVACGEDVDVNDYINPSTYLLRHVYATVNVLLLYSTAMRQYYQGHKIDDPAISRRTMTTSVVQQIVQKKREAHPLLNSQTKTELDLTDRQTMTTSGYSETIIIPSGVSMEINVLADEPGDAISVHIRNTGGKELTGELRWVEAWTDPIEEGYTYPINVQRFGHDLYAPAAKMLLEAFPGLYDGVAPWDEHKKMNDPFLQTAQPVEAERGAYGLVAC